MKKFKFVASLIAAAALAQSAFAITEGNEYITLSTPIANAEKSVVEIWSYRCTHCYSHHRAGTMEKIAAALPDAKMGYLIVKTMGDYGKQAAEVMAYAEYLDEKANRSLAASDSMYHKVADAYFTAYFKRNQRWGNGANPAAFYAVGLKVLGIDKATLDKFVASPEGAALIAKQDPADAISKNFGTPGFVVNGKYEVNISKIASPAALIEVVKELIAK